MRLLLDTHTFLWFLEGNSQLSDVARTLIEDANSDVLLSVGSLWEMAIKVSLGKLQVGTPFDQFVRNQLAINSIELLGITIEHAAAVASLPMQHRDPFDRLLIAQALVEQIPIVSVDAAFDASPLPAFGSSVNWPSTMSRCRCYSLESRVGQCLTDLLPASLIRVSSEHVSYGGPTKAGETPAVQ